VSAPDRAQALARAERALGDFALLGCQTNAAFLRRLTRHPAFVAGEVHTGFLDANPEIAAPPPHSPERLGRLLAVAALSTRRLTDAADAVPALHASLGHWRN